MPAGQEISAISAQIRRNEPQRASSANLIDVGVVARRAWVEDRRVARRTTAARATVSRVDVGDTQGETTAMSARATLLRCAGAVASTSASGAWVAEQRCGVLPRVIVIVARSLPSARAPRLEVSRGCTAARTVGSPRFRAAVSALDSSTSTSRLARRRGTAAGATRKSRAPRPARGDRAPRRVRRPRAQYQKWRSRRHLRRRPRCRRRRGSSPSAEDSTVDRVPAPGRRPPSPLSTPWLARSATARRRVVTRASLPRSTRTKISTRPAEPQRRRFQGGDDRVFAGSAWTLLEKAWTRKGAVRRQGRGGHLGRGIPGSTREISKCRQRRKNDTS